MPQVVSAFRPDGALDARALARAAELLRAGRLVAFPTETVYGLGAHALDPKAVRGVFAAKGRPDFNPLIVHVATIAEARALAATWPAEAQRLAEAFWPGPLSLIVPRGPRVPLEVTGGLDAVALRSPAHPVARALLETSGLPIAAPSANRFMAVSPTTAAHVVASLGDKVDLVLDGGATDVGIESTVLDLTGPRPALLRPGGLSAATLEAFLGPIGRGPGVLDSGPRVSPGMLARHYSPRGECRLVGEGEFATALTSLPADARIGAIVQALARPPDRRIVAWERLGSKVDTFARDLYAALHRLDEANATHVLLASPPETPEWEAVADRMRRAAG